MSAFRIPEEASGVCEGSMLAERDGKLKLRNRNYALFGIGRAAS
jgi:hypothetical protein